LNLSENYVYERIDFSNLDHSTLLDRIKEMVKTHLPIKEKIISNLNEKLFRDRLEYLIQFDLHDQKFR
jgi:dihydroorotate dehydrogenase